jgi:hypothetical protein
MTQAMLENELHSYKDSGFISDIIKEFRIGAPKTSNSKQFYAPFMIQFEDRVRWIIYSTTSMRTDRIKGQQWDAFNLKRLDPSIEKAYLTYPDNVDSSVKSEFERQDKKYTTGNEFSSIDRILSHSDLAALVLQESDIKFKEDVCPDDSSFEQTDTDIYNGNDPLKQGRAWDFEGRKFESDLAEILSSKDFFNALKNSNDGKYNNNKCFSIYREICSCLKIDIANTREIKATSDKHAIGLLPTGGSPKTDVLVYVVNKDNSQTMHTISCKRSKANYVSVHQYTADAFADVWRNLFNRRVFG